MMTNEKILTIDDDEAIINSFYIYLSDCGYQTISASNGAEGIQLFEQEKPDIVLVDLRMPGINGFEVITKITKISPETPLIVVSGIGELDDAINAIRLGAWDYLTKPVEDLSSLQHTIEKALERARLIKENREYREHLEDKVESRTKELTEANQHLIKMNERLRQIVVSSHNISTCSTIESFTQCAMNEFSYNMDVSGGSFYFVGENNLSLAYALDSGHAPIKIDFPLTENSVFEKVLKKKVPLLIDDITKESNLTPSGWQKYRYRSAMIFPLVDESNFVIAVLALHNKATSHFTQLDKEMGTILVSFCCESLRAVRATKEIIRSENRLNLAIQGANLGTWDWHLPSDKVMYNEQCGRISGYHIDDMEQNHKTWDKMIHEEDRPSVKAAIDKHLTGMTETYESKYRIQHKSGHFVRVLDRGKVIERDASGKPLHMCGTYLELNS